MTDIKIRLDNINESNDDALELFYSGIKSAETRRTMEQNLRRFLVDVCEDILNGSFSERAKQFVILAKKNGKTIDVSDFGESDGLSWKNMVLEKNDV